MRGNVGILVWRADAEPSSGGSDGRRKPKQNANRASNAAPVEKAPNKVIGASKKPPSVVLHSLLKPTEAQRAMLDTIFSGPVLLRKLLQESGVQPRTQEEASLLLLQHHKALQPYLYANDRSTAVELLKKLVLDWGRTSPELIELEFPHDCSISAKNEVYLPVPRLGVLPVADVAEMQAERKGRRYKTSFVLIHSPWGYIAEIELRGNAERDTNVAVEAPRPQPKKGRVKAAKTSGRIPFAQFMAMFDNALNARLMSELRISSRYVKPDFDALQGRPVQGGLPSLGKGR